MKILNNILNSLKGKVNMSNQANILKKTLLDCFIKITLCIAIAYGIYYGFSLVPNFITIDIKSSLSGFIAFIAQQNSLFYYMPAISLFSIFLCNCTLYKISKEESIEEHYLCYIHKIFKNTQQSIIIILSTLFGLFLASKITYLNDISNSEKIVINLSNFISTFCVLSIMLIILFSFILLFVDNFICEKTRLKKYDLNKVKVKTK